MIIHAFRDNLGDIWLSVTREDERESQRFKEQEAEEIVKALQTILNGNKRYDGCV